MFPFKYHLSQINLYAGETLIRMMLNPRQLNVFLTLQLSRTNDTSMRRAGRIPTFAAISRQYLCLPRKDRRNVRAGDKVALCSRRGRNRSGEPRPLLIDGSLSRFLPRSPSTGQKPAREPSLASFSPLSFSFPSTPSTSRDPLRTLSASFFPSCPPFLPHPRARARCLPFARAPSAKERSFEGRARRM